MPKFTHNGITYTGEEITIKDGKLWVDGKPVVDFNPNTEEIIVIGNGNIACDKAVTIQGLLQGDILSAEKVVINGQHNGSIHADKVIINGEHYGTININKLTDNR